MATRKADVTVGQVMDVRAMANAKGLTREQFQAGMGTVIPEVLDAIKSGWRIKVLPSIQPLPWGGTPIYVDDVPVRLDGEWNTAINEAGPDTLPDSTVCQLGDLYPPTGVGVVGANLALVPLAGGSYGQALEWATQNYLLPAPPRHVFGLAKHKPSLHREVLKRDLAYVVSPVERIFRGEAHVCDVWFRGERRKAHAYWVRNVGRADAFVAFLGE